MATENSNRASELPTGVQIGSNRPTGVEYFGTEQALIDAKILEPAWVDALGGFSRQIARLPDGGYQVIGEGVGNRLRKEHKERGAFSVSRNRDGTISVFVFRTPEEYKKEKALYDTQRESEYIAYIEAQRLAKEKETWQLAKEAHEQSDFPKRWKDGVLYHIEHAEKLIEGKMVFTDFPEVGIAESDVLEAKRIIADLKHLLARVTPAIKNKVRVQSNVFSLNSAAFRNMKKH